MAYPRFIRSKQLKKIHDVAGDITVSANATWEELAGESGGPGSGGLDIELTENQAGDIVQVTMGVKANSAAVVLDFDVASIVSSSPVNYVSTGTATAGGIPGLNCATGVDAYVSASMFFELQAGDLSGLSLTLRPYVRGSSATTRVVNANSTTGLHFAAVNLGPAQV